MVGGSWGRACTNVRSAARDGKRSHAAFRRSCREMAISKWPNAGDGQDVARNDSGR